MIDLPTGVVDGVLIDLVLDLYHDRGQWDGVYPSDIGYKVLQRRGEVSIVVCRGSTTLPDWIENFIDVPVYVPGLGRVEKGFLDGAMAFFDAVRHEVAPPIVVTGHSRGAAVADILAAKLLLEFGTGVWSVTFAKPRPGFASLSALLARRARWYRNRKDPVTFVPYLFGEYQHPGDLVLLDVPPPAGDPWGPLAEHHSELYAAGVHALAHQEAVA